MSKFCVKKNSEIETIFNESQNTDFYDSLIQQLIRIHNKSNEDDFVYEFITCLKTLFGATGNDDCVDRIFEFAVQFVVHLVGLYIRDESNMSMKSKIFFRNMFEFFRMNHNLPSKIVRKRICQFISKLMQEIKSPCTIMVDRDISEIIKEIMLERIKDRYPVIRKIAILALCRLQITSGGRCDITKAFVNCMEIDTSAEVRELALSKLTIIRLEFIKPVIDRTNDVSENVRRMVYSVIHKVDVRILKIEERQKLLNNGLNDKNWVKKAVKNKLLPAWFKQVNYEYLRLLKTFDLNVNFMETATKALMSLFHNAEDKCVNETLGVIMDNTRTIPFERLTSESAFFWKNYVFFKSNLVSEEDNYRWDYGKSYDAVADGLLPDLSFFCAYIEEYCVGTKGKSDKSLWEKKEEEFILIQLIELCKTYDYGDEVGREKLESLCLKLLEYIEMETIRPVVELYFMLRTNHNESISKITEIRVIWEVVQSNVDPAVTRLRGNINEFENQRKNAVQNEDYVSVRKLEKDISDALYEIQRLNATIPMASRSSSIDIIEQNMKDQEKKRHQRCLTILQEVLHFSFVTRLTPELRTLLHLLVLPACELKHPIVTPMAIKVLGAYCLRNDELAKKYFHSIGEWCHEESTSASALEAFFDLLLSSDPNKFGINELIDYKNPENSKSKSKKRKTNCSEPLDESNEEEYLPTEINRPPKYISGLQFINYLLDLLNNVPEDAFPKVVHGLCQLMMTGKLKSSDVLSRLILIWFNPVYKKSPEINDTLNYFFPLFVKRCSWALSLFERAIMKTMDILFEAREYSPLRLVDQNGVLERLCELTEPRLICENAEVGENIHFKLAISMCERIKRLEDTDNLAVLLHGLNRLNLSSTDSSMLLTLKYNLNGIINKFEEGEQKNLKIKAKRLLSKIQSKAQKMTLA